MFLSQLIRDWCLNGLTETNVWSSGLYENIHRFGLVLCSEDTASLHAVSPLTHQARDIGITSA